MLLVRREIRPTELEEWLQALRAEEVNPAVGWAIMLARGAGVVVLHEAEAVPASEGSWIRMVELGERIAELLPIIAAFPGALHVAQQQVVATAAEYLGYGQAGLPQCGEAGGFCREEVGCNVCMHFEEEVAAVLQYKVISLVDVAASHGSLCHNACVWSVEVFQLVGKTAGE